MINGITVSTSQGLCLFQSPNIKLHQNLSGGGRNVPRGQTDMMKLLSVMLQTHLKVDIKQQVENM